MGLKTDLLGLIDQRVISLTGLLVQSRVFLGSQHEIWSKQHNGKVTH